MGISDQACVVQSKQWEQVYLFLDILQDVGGSGLIDNSYGLKGGRDIELPGLLHQI